MHSKYHKDNSDNSDERVWKSEKAMLSKKQQNHLQIHLLIHAVLEVDTMFKGNL